MLSHLFEIKAELGSSFEAEPWDKGWTKVYETIPLEPFSAEYLERVAARTAQVMVCWSHPPNSTRRKTMKNGKVVVLYVEDEPNLAELLRAGLGMFGMIVSPIYCSAEELLGKISSTEFTAADIMVLDIRLPGLTGLELAKRLRGQAKTDPL